MKARPSFQFYPADWLRDPGLRSCSLGARGLWIDILSFMHEAEPYGHLTLNGHDIDPETLARMVGAPLRGVRQSLAELETAGVFSRTEEGTIFSRRMVRDEALRKKRAEGGPLSLNHPDVPRKKEKDGSKDTFKDTLPPSLDGSFGGSPSSSSSSSSSSSKEKEKRAGCDEVEPAVSSPSKRKVELTDEEFLAELRQNPAYKHLDIDMESGKLDAWLKTPRGKGKVKTRQRFVTWLNRAADDQRPLASPASLSTAPLCTERVHDGDGRHFQPCGKPIAPDQTPPVSPFCPEHIQHRQRIAARLANGHAS